MEKDPHIRLLFANLLDNSITEDDYNKLVHYFGSDLNREQIRELIIQTLEQENDQEILETHAEQIQQTIQNARAKLQRTIHGNEATGKNTIIKLIPYLSVALLILMGTGSYLIYKQNHIQQNQISTHVADDIAPGSNRATLSIEGTETISLSGLQQGLITDGSTISYTDGTAVRSLEKAQIVTVSTPLAGQYQVQLPDGTRAWLNASSSISYPSSFDEDKRKISVTGEVFLEVFKNAKQPFIVTAKGQEIEVLGTSFNINSYADNGKLYTTLTEGSLKVTSTINNSTVVLKPGDQSVISENASITINHVDTEEISSWKEGFYQIKNQSLALFSKQIERWYDVDFQVGNKGTIQLSALVPRNVNLSEVLQAIELKTGIRFKIEGRRVTVID